MRDLRDERAALPKKIPEMLGFSKIPHDRERSYSRMSYQAQYLLHEDEAQALLDRHGKEAHKAIDRELSLRYLRDADYERRIDEARMDNEEVPEEERKQAEEKLRNKKWNDIGKNLS